MIRILIVFALLMSLPISAGAETIMVGDVEISPADFSASQGPEKRMAKCLSCHGDHAGGDNDFGPDIHYGTPALRGVPHNGVPACMACHGPLGEGSAVGPRLAGQNVMYIENQFEAFAGGARQTAQSAAMQPVVAGLTDEDVRAVAHYYSSIGQ